MKCQHFKNKQKQKKTLLDPRVTWRIAYAVLCQPHQTVKQLLIVIYDLKVTLVESWPPLTKDNANFDANIRNLLRY